MVKVEFRQKKYGVESQAHTALLVITLRPLRLRVSLL